jgi:2'-5' RNA ligase
MARCVVDVAGPLRKALPDLRWTPEENLHSTLVFLGEQSAWDAALIRECLERESKGAGIGKIPLRTGSLALFPRGANASVLALRIASGEKAVRVLAERVVRALGGFGFQWKRERRAFTPHITLARRGRIPLRASEIPETTLEAGGTFETIGLFKSDLYPSGPVYTPLALFPLE